MTSKSVPVTVRGQHFHSMTACAKHFGVNVGHVCIMLDRGTLDNIGKGRNFDRKKPTFLNGQRFESIADLAKFAGISAVNLAARIRRHTAAGRDHIDIEHGRVTWGQA